MHQSSTSTRSALTLIPAQLASHQKVYKNAPNIKQITAKGGATEGGATEGGPLREGHRGRPTLRVHSSAISNTLMYWATTALMLPAFNNYCVHCAHVPRRAW